MPVKRCNTGSRRCSVSKKCVPKSARKSARCNKGSRKCADSKCYKNKKSVKSRRYYNKTARK